MVSGHFKFYYKVYSKHQLLNNFNWRIIERSKQIKAFKDQHLLLNVHKIIQIGTWICLQLEILPLFKLLRSSNLFCSMVKTNHIFGLIDTQQLKLGHKYARNSQFWHFFNYCEMLQKLYLLDFPRIFCSRVKGSITYIN